MIIRNGKRLDGMGDSMPIGSIVEYNGTDIPDGWEILPGDANVYIGLEEPVDGQEVWIQQGRNLFDKNNFNRLEAYIEGGDTLITAHDYNKTLFIPCEPNTTYTIQKYKSNVFTVGYTVAFPAVGVQAYGGVFGTRADYDGQIVSETFTTGANAEYLLVRYYNASSDTTITEREMLDSIQIELGDTVNDYKLYTTKKIYIKNAVGKYEEFVNKKNLGTITVDEVKQKNLFNVFGPSTESGNYDYTTSLDGSLYCPPLSGNGGYILYTEKYKNNGTFVLSYDRVDGTITRPFFRCYDSTGEELSIADVGMSYVYNSVYRGYWYDYYDAHVSVNINLSTDVAYFQIGFVGLEYTINNIMLTQGDVEFKYVPQINYGVWSGYNDNGHWIKYADGTLIQRINVTLGSCVFGLYNDAYPGLYTDQTNGGHYTWTFPMEFIDDSYTCSLMVQSSAYMCSSLGTKETSYITGYYHANYAFTSNIKLEFIAIGRWK